MSGWVADTEAAKAEAAAAAADSERQRLAPSSSSSNISKAPILGAKSVLMIWTLFVLGFVLILCAAIAFSSGFSGGGTGCLLAGIACLVGASVWQWRLSGARLIELGRSGSAAYPHGISTPVGAYNIQDEAEGPAAGFHF